jgi:histidinol-phosphate aminotransferase
MIPLDRNESYWLLTDELLSYCKEYDVRALSTYPRYDDLKQKLASYAGVSTDNLSLTPGSDAAIQEFARAYVGAGGLALLPVPTFYGYESILERVGANVLPVTYIEEDGRFVFPIEETCRLLETEQPQALFLCNPNNPLGSPIPDEYLERLCRATAVSGTLLVVDEAYYEYSGRTVVGRFADTPNLVIFRTLSKGFGIPGARVGYCIARPEIVKTMEALMLPWPVAHTSAAAALALLGRIPEVTICRERTITEREHLKNALETWGGCTVYPSETNFLLIRVPDAARTAAVLKERGIAVATGDWMSKHADAKHLLASTLRIATPAPEDREQLIDILSKM